MRTETQKNFKKQMAEIQKDMANRENDQFFSYIENDHIESYYKPKKHKKAAVISLGSVISFLIFGYCIYTWIRPLVNNTSRSYTVINPVSLDNRVGLPQNHMDIVEYLDGIKKYDDRLNTYYKESTRDFRTILKDQNSRSTYIVTNTAFKGELEDIILSLSKMQVPEKMNNYHSTVKEKYDNVFEEVIYCINIAESNNTKDISHLNYLIERNNLLEKQQREQMLSVFDIVGIKYEQSGTSITFWYNKK